MYIVVHETSAVLACHLLSVEDHVSGLLITVGHQSISAQNSNYSIAHAFRRKFCPVNGKGSYTKPHVRELERKMEVVGSFE